MTDETPAPEDKTPAIIAEMRELASRIVDGFEKIPAEFRAEFAALKAAAKQHA